MSRIFSRFVPTFASGYWWWHRSAAEGAAPASKTIQHPTDPTPLQLQVEGAFFLPMTPSVRDRDRPIDGRTPGCPRCRGERRHGGVASRWRVRPRRGGAHSTAGVCPPSSPAARCGRAATSTAAKRSGDRFSPPHWTVALNAWTSSFARSKASPLACRSAISFPRVPSASSSRRMISMVCLPISSRARARCEGPAPGRSRSQCQSAASARRSALKTIAKDGDAVVIGMGEPVWRRGCSRRASDRAWTYAGDGVAPGQIPARQMIDDYGFRRVSPSTRIFGVVSPNALHSLSPVMHNAAFEAAGLDAVYVPLPVHDFERLPGVRGGDGRRGRERHDSVQAGCAAGRGIERRVDAAGRRREHASQDWLGLGGDQHRRRRVSAPLGVGMEHVDGRRSCVRPWRRRRGARGRRRLASSGAQRHRACAARRAGAGAGVELRRRVWCVAAGVRVVGPAGQLHATRRRGAARGVAAAGGPIDGSACLRPDLRTRASQRSLRDARAPG